MSPLIPMAGAWLLGLAVGAGWSPGTWGAALGVAALSTGLALTVWGFSARAPTNAPGWLAAVACGAALTAGLSVGRASGEPPLPPEGMVRVTVEVLETRHGTDGRARSIVRVLDGARVGDGQPVPRGSLLSATPSPLQRGERAVLLGKLRPLRPFRNPTPHPPPPARFALVGRLWLPGPDAVSVIEPGRRWLEGARGNLRARLDATLSPEDAGLARALMLGDADAVSESDRERMRGAGLSHMLAVSGLHVTLLAGLWVGLLRRGLLAWPAFALRFEARRFACALGIPFALGYAEFAGGAPSAWRAAATAVLGFALHAAAVPVNAGACAAAAALVLGALSPADATRPAFLLSIVATAAILSRPGDTAAGLRGAVREAFAISARTTLATAPIVLWCFGNVPLIGLLANVVLVPIGSWVVVPLAAVHSLCALALPEAALSARLFELSSQAFVTACGVFAGVAPDGAWPPPSLSQGIVFALGCAALLALRGARERLWVVSSMLCALALCEWRLRASEKPEGALRITYLDVGQGDSALVDLPDGRAMLIDAGGSPNGGPDPGARVLVPLLHARRRDHIDIAVLSHPHPDHYGGFAAVLDAVTVGEVWDSGQAEAERELAATSHEATALLRRARERGARVRLPNELCGRALTAGEAELRLLSPCPRYDSGYDENDNSLVVRIDFRGRSALFTGDAEAHAESRLLSQGAALRAELLKVGHHGSRTSTTAAFLARVAPRLAVISAGASNPFGHPHVEVTERLQAGAPHVIELAKTGGVIAETEGARWRVRTWSGLELRP